MRAQFPEKLQCLFQPARYKVLYGGRGGAKSWGVARALLILAAQKPLRVLCAREVQKSIADSVHKLLSDQIKDLGLSDLYEVQETVIKGLNGSEFLFAGLRQHDISKIKSFEGADICWVEEGQTVSDKSWNVLIPTIRKPASEIWVTFNPELDTDATYVRFVAKPPPGAVVVKIGWQDNPWFPKELEDERQHLQAVDPEAYRTVWEGECRAAVQGAIYADEIRQAYESGRVTTVPYNPELKAHVVFDLGWSDAMSIGVVQQHGGAMRFVKYIEDTHKTLDYYSSLLKDLRWNWGQVWLPHDGAHRDHKYGKSSQEIMQAMGWDVRIVPNLTIEEGIRIARQGFGRCYFDANACEFLVDRLKRYKRAISTTTNEPGAPLHDENSHAADMFRYAHIVAEQMTNETWGGNLKYPSLNLA